MGKRGPKPKERVKIEWSADFAYAIGLIATDGFLSGDGRHVTLVSKDVEQLENFCKALCIDYDPSLHSSGFGSGKIYYRIQIGDVIFYKFLESIGFTAKKSLTLSSIKLPQEYFFDFLRGCLDGDGCTYSYFDPRWKSSFMFYLSFVSGSKHFIDWLQSSVRERIPFWGHVVKVRGKLSKNPYYQLRYAKSAALVLIRKMYYHPTVICLSRKREKIIKMLAVAGEKI